MKNNLLELNPARARSDPSSPAGVRGDPQRISALRIDPPEQIEKRGHPPEVRHTRNGPPADSARGKPSEVQNVRKAPRAESRMNEQPPQTPPKEGRKKGMPKWELEFGCFECRRHDMIIENKSSKKRMPKA
jgi:ribosomal protein L44E